MSPITPAPAPGRAPESRPEATTPPAAPASVVEEVLAHEVGDGRSRRWDDHRAARRAELVRAARRTVHRTGPDVSMEEIAAAAGTSKSIVYRYFADKTGLQVAVGEAVVAQMHAALDEAARAAATPRDGLRAMIDVYLEMVEGSPHVYWFVTRPLSEDASAPLGHFLEAVAGMVARPFARVVTGGSSAAMPYEVDVWAAGAVGFVRGAGEWWLTHRDEPSAPTREELTERVTAWLWAGPVSVLSRSRGEAGEPRAAGAAPATSTPPEAPEPPAAVRPADVSTDPTDLTAEEQS